MSTILRSHKTASGNKPILGIRARLMLLALLAVVPLMLDRVRILEAGRAERIEMASGEAMDLARRALEQQNELAMTARALLQAVAHAYVSAPAAAGGCASYLDGFAKDIPWIASLSVVDAGGRIVCSTSPVALGLDVSDRAYFRDALASGRFVVSDYLVSRARGEPRIIAAYPTHMENSAPVVIIAPINLQWLAHFAGAAGRRAGTSVSLIDGKGTVLTRYPNWGAPGMKMADHPLASAMLQQDEGFITTADIDNVHRIFAYVAAPSTGAHIAVGLDEAEILSRIDHQIYVAYAQLAIFGLLTLFLAWSAGERLIVGPIRLLARKAARVGRGEFDTHVEKNTWMAEFGSLAAALDDMTRKLAEREQELHSANRHLTALAASDSLSGLANRRSFDARLESEWQIAAEFKRPIALLMIDVDHFKLFNDRYGHVEGDNCLRGVAEVLAAMASGEADFAARYGGEEFALLLPGVAMETAVATAGRLRRRIEKLGIAHTETPAGTVTISIGVAAFVPRQNDKAEKLVEAADIGLYAAKRRGRNAVVAHAPVALAEAG